jgi:hypothetical protein
MNVTATHTRAPDACLDDCMWLLTTLMTGTCTGTGAPLLITGCRPQCMVWVSQGLRYHQQHTSRAQEAPSYSAALPSYCKLVKGPCQLANKSSRSKQPCILRSWHVPAGCNVHSTQLKSGSLCLQPSPGGQQAAQREDGADPRPPHGGWVPRARGRCAPPHHHRIRCSLPGAPSVRLRCAPLLWSHSQLVPMGG